MTNWPIKTLGDVCEVIAGQSPEGKFYNQAGQGTPFYQGKKDFTERFLGSPSTWTTEITKLAQPGDILMSVRAPVGPVNLCPIEACIGRGLAAIRPSKEADTEFVYYYLESIQSEIAGTEGAVFASINKAQIAELRFPVPPLDEQKRIVALLDDATARITELTSCYEQARAHANNLFTSALRNSLESNPDWLVKTLGDVCEIVNGATPDTKAKKNWGGAHAWITPAEMGGLDSPFLSNSRRMLSDEGLASCSARLVPPHSVILSSRAPIGHVVINAVPMATNQGCKSLIPGKGLDFKFLFYFLKGNVELLESLGTGTTFKELSGTQLKKVALPVPPLEEQKRIVARLDQMQLKTAEMVAAYDAKLQAAKNLRQSILEAAFAGEL